MNLIITCARHFEKDAQKEITEILKQTECKDIDVIISEMSGILFVNSSCDPVEIIRGLKKIFVDEPWSVRYCLRIIPIHHVISTNLDEITEIAKTIEKKIEEGQKYRITVEKRECDIPITEIITKIANNISNPVSLEHPDVIILVEILKDITGIALIRPGDIFSLDKSRRSISE